MTIRIDLRPAMFGEREHVLATAPGGAARIVQG